MFPSSGVFAHIGCPFAQRGLCERPHCLYKHVTESWETFGGLYKSPAVDLTGDSLNDACGVPIKYESTDDCLHELEKINQKIETVKHEVEQEQRRLSCYQTKQANWSNDTFQSKSPACGSYGLPSSENQHSRKYVVDNSKPKTDLEYDPLSNFSAALKSYSSSSKEHKDKNQQDTHRKKALHVDEKRQSSPQEQMKQSPSLEIMDDSNEDSVLIIDVPLSPEKTNGLALVSVYSGSGKSSQDAKETINLKTDLLHSPKLNFKNSQVDNAISSSAIMSNGIKACSSFASKEDQDSEMANNGVDGSIVDLTGYFENLENLCQKAETDQLAEPAVFTLIQDHENCSTSRKHDQSSSAETTNQLQMQNYLPSRDSLLSYCPLMQQASRTEQSTGDENQNKWLCAKSGPAVEGSQNALGRTSGKLQGNYKATNEEKAEENNSFLPQSIKPCSSAESTEQLLKEDDQAVIIINSSFEEDEEFQNSEVELSDSDPLEECYRIFMEANCEDKMKEEQLKTASAADTHLEKPTINTTSQALGKRRLAHESKNTEQPLAKSRPQPQVLVPLQEPVASGLLSRPFPASNIQQVQQRASLLSSSIRGGQAFVSSNNQKKTDTQSAPPVLDPTSENLLPASVPNAYINYLPLGTAFIEVGNNVHVILPQGSFPLSVASTSGQATSVLTPASQVPGNPDKISQTAHPPTVTHLSRYRSTAPVLIAAPPRRAPLSSAFASSVPSVASSMSSHAPVQVAAVQAAAKPLPVKRKLKQQAEAAKAKVPHDVRQRYVNMFTEEFLKSTADVNEAFEKALAEEKSVYNRSVNKLKYLSIAVNALKRLKNQTAAPKQEKMVRSDGLKGNIPFNRRRLNENDDSALYESLKDYLLTVDKMIENNYPIQNTEKPGSAVLVSDRKANTDYLKRICCRCGATYSVSQTGKHVRKEECNYHYGKGVKNRVPGGVETRYSCCQGIIGAPGCQVFKLHVHDSVSLDGFVSTASRCPSDTSCPGVYSLDCEMCYTVQGLELSRVTVVDSNLHVIYDTFVKPDSEVIDYNSRFSGISEEDVKGHNTSLREVQKILLSFICADTILVGHCLETDLCLLKLFHGMVVDTSVVFPHRLGPPNKLSLNSLTAEHLQRIIQDVVCGHDTAEDASACMELMLWKMKEDGKLKK